MKVNTKNTSQQAIIENRRHVVAELRLRGATQREIIDLLIKQGLTNKGKPWSVGIINRDIQFLENEWRKAAVRDMSTLKANQLAEIRTARRQAWKDKNLAEVRQLIKLEIELLGTAAPIDVAIEHNIYDHRTELLATVAGKFGGAASGRNREINQKPVA